MDKHEGALTDSAPLHASGLDECQLLSETAQKPMKLSLCFHQSLELMDLNSPVDEFAIA